MFGLIDGVMFRAPAYIAHAEALHRIGFVHADPLTGRTVSWRSSFPHMRVVASSGAFRNVAAYCTRAVSLGYGPEARPAQAMFVTPNFFVVTGVRATVGAVYTDASAWADGDERAVLSYALWQRAFGGDAATIGSTVLINGHPYVIAGIAPKGFTALQRVPADLWIQLGSAAGDDLLPRDWRVSASSFWLEVIARLDPRVALAAAEGRGASSLRAWSRSIAAGDATGILTAPLFARDSEEAIRNADVYLALAGLTTVVLLIACANVANLLLSRSALRAREYAIRQSLGASISRLRLQLLSDVVLIAMPAIACAALVDMSTRRIMDAFIPPDLPFAGDLLDERALVQLAASGIIALLLLSVFVLTQFRISQSHPSLSVRAGTASRRSWMHQHLLLGAQAGLCVILLLFAALFSASLRRVHGLDLGVQLDRTLQVSLPLTSTGRTAAEIDKFYQTVALVLSRHPGIERVATVESNPYSSGRAAGPRTAEKSAESLWSVGEVPYITAVGAGFFAAVGANALRGRDFAKSDGAGAPLVAIINAPLARRLWPGLQPLGQCLWLDETRGCVRVVGVLPGVWKLRALSRDKMAIYVPLAQTRGVIAGALMVRIRGGAGHVATDVRSIVQSAEPGLPAASVVLARDLVEWEFRSWRVGATLFSAFGGIALFIVLMGMYSVVAFAAAAKVQEVAVRLALGARWTHVANTIARNSLIAVSIGLVLGLSLAVAVGVAMQRMFFQTSPYDPAALVRTAVLLLGTSLLAVVPAIVRSLRCCPARLLNDT